MTKIQIITGSTRPSRVNKQVADWAYSLANKRDDLQIELVDIARFDLPHLDEPVPASMGQYSHAHTKKWSDKIAQADGYIFITPEYNHSFPGALKNALDFLYAEWNNKAAGFVGYGNAGGARSIEHMRGIMGELQIADVRTAVHLSLFTDFENYSVFKPGPGHEERFNVMLDQLIAWTNALKAVREERIPELV